MMPVSFAVCSKTIHIHLIAYMECKYQRQKACGGVSPMMLEPVFIDVFHKSWIINQDLFFFDFDFPWNWNICASDWVEITSHVLKRKKKSFLPHISYTVHAGIVLIMSEVDCACGESGDNPAQVQGFEGDQDHAHVFFQLFVALRVNEVVSGLAPNI